MHFSLFFQRYEELSTKWDQAKHEVRIEDREVLQEKIVLQQELIRKQDEYAEQRRSQLAEAETQVSLKYVDNISINMAFIFNYCLYVHPSFLKYQW